MSSKSAKEPAHAEIVVDVMLRNFVGRLNSLCRQIGRIAAEERTVLAITNSPRIQMDLRVLAIQERWHMIFAQDLATGLLLARLQKTVVVMYDDETADADWHAASRGFSDYGIPVFFVLLATVPDRRLWRSVLDRGGFDVAHRRVERRKLAPIINSAFDLAEDINSKLRTGSKLVPMP